MSALKALQKLLGRIDVEWYRGQVDCLLPPEIPQSAHGLLLERMQAAIEGASGPQELMLDLTRRAAERELLFMVEAGVLRLDDDEWSFHDPR